MSESGRCHCGAITYEVVDEAAPIYHAMCHCSDCRRSSGAPAITWALFRQDQVNIEGTPKLYKSSEHGQRFFCSNCGSSLFYINEQIFPGQIDIQSATFDDPEVYPLSVQVQVAERVGYMKNLGSVPAFERYPGSE